MSAGELTAKSYDDLTETNSLTKTKSTLPYAPLRSPKRRSRFRAHPVLSLHPRMSGGVLASMHGRKLEGGDMGDTIAILLLLTIFLIGICAFLGWYSRRRG